MRSKFFFFALFAVIGVSYAAERIERHVLIGPAPDGNGNLYRVSEYSDRDNDGIEDSADECPDDATNRCNIPDTDGDGFQDDVDECPEVAGTEDGCPPAPATHDHFNALQASPNKLGGWSLRYTDPNDYGMLAQNPAYQPNPRIEYDPVMDAAKATVPGTSNSFSSASQLFLDHVDTTIATADGSLVYQGDFRFSESCRRIGSTVGTSVSDPTLTRTVSNWKFDRIDVAGWNPGLELQTRFSTVEQPWVTVPTYRSYIGYGASRAADPISGPVAPEDVVAGVTNYDMHPGTGSKNYYKNGPTTHPERFTLYAERWIRKTVELTSGPNGETLFRVWLADEFTDPVLIVSDPADPSKGFNLGAASANKVFAGWRFPEMNTSDAATYDPPHEPWIVWLRNAVVLKGVCGDCVLGGRPLASN